MKYLPTVRQAAIHSVAMITLSGLFGPLLGPWLINWINPPNAWGNASVIGDYSLKNVLIWGFALLMFESFFYIAWLIKQGRRDWEKEQPKSWYN
ncbi:MAG: hypothetical protein NTY60_10630 [Proteobacteria bacterium]|nr:hypothetical protein [Pseudomonadota bacterium]